MPRKNVRCITSAASEATNVPKGFDGNYTYHLDVRIKWPDSRRTYVHSCSLQCKPVQPIARGPNDERGDIWSVKMSFNSFPGKAETELRGNLNFYKLCTYGDIHYITLHYITLLRRLRVFDNRVLRKISGPKRDEITGECRTLHINELYNLYQLLYGW